MACTYSSIEECLSAHFSAHYHVISSTDQSVPLYVVQALLLNSSCPQHQQSHVSAHTTNQILARAGALSKLLDGEQFIVNIEKKCDRERGKWVEKKGNRVDSTVWFALALVVLFAAVLFGIQGKCVDFTSPGALESCTDVLVGNPKDCGARLVRARAYLDRNLTDQGFEDFEVLAKNCKEYRWTRQISLTMNQIVKSLDTESGRFGYFKKFGEEDIRKRVQLVDRLMSETAQSK